METKKKKIKTFTKCSFSLHLHGQEMRRNTIRIPRISKTLAYMALHTNDKSINKETFPRTIQLRKPNKQADFSSLSVLQILQAQPVFSIVGLCFPFSNRFLKFPR